MPRLSLNEQVKCSLNKNGKIVWYQGVVVGRTLEAQSHYDVRISGGKIIANISADQLRSLEHVRSEYRGPTGDLQNSHSANPMRALG